MDFRLAKLPEKYSNLKEVIACLCDFNPSFHAWIKHLYEGMDRNKMEKFSFAIRDEVDWDLKEFGEGEGLEIAKETKEIVLDLLTDPNWTVLDLFLSDCNIDIYSTIKGLFDAWRKRVFDDFGGGEKKRDGGKCAKCVLIAFRSLYMDPVEHRKEMEVVKEAFDFCEELFDSQKNCQFMVLSFSKAQTKILEDLKWVGERWLTKPHGSDMGETVEFQLYDTKDVKMLPTFQKYTDNLVRSWDE